MSIWGRVRNFVRRERLSLEIDDELAAHVAMRADDNVSAGMSADEARRDARLRFGSRGSRRRGGCRTQLSRQKRRDIPA